MSERVGVRALAPSLEKAPNRSFSLNDGVLVAGFLAAAVGACLDFEFLGLGVSQTHRLYCFFWIAVLVFFDREGHPRSRFALTISLFAFNLLYGDLLRHYAPEAQSRRDCLKLLAFSPSPWLWLAALWFATPVLLDRRGVRYGKVFRLSLIALCSFGAQSFASTISSRNPLRSLSEFSEDLGLYLALLIPWFRAALSCEPVRHKFARGLNLIIGSLLLVSGLAGLFFVFGSETLRETMVRAGVLFREASPDPTLPRLRLIFPMQNFNRTAYLGLAGILMLLLGALRPRLGTGRRWETLAVAPGALVIFLTSTRGAVAALGAALVFWGLLSSRRFLVLLVAGTLGVFVLLPTSRREHFLSVLSVATYHPEPGRVTSMSLRLKGWETGLLIVRENLWWGLGYGPKVLEQVYPRYGVRTGDFESKPHLHNVWLEYAAESGVLAALAFLIWTLLRWSLLWGAYRGAADRATSRYFAGWLAVEVSLFLFGLFFFMLRRNFGLLTWIIWAMALCEAEAQRPGRNGMETEGATSRDARSRQTTP
ncbi:MAG: O-antigen ligase family protein [bacterium]